MQRTGIDSTTADLLHSAVHNLKGPASRLRLLSQLLSRSGAALDEDSRSLLRHIEDSAAAVGVVAEGLRGYAEVCARPMHRQPVELGRLAVEAQTNLRSEIESVGAQITADRLPAAQADPFLMSWLFQELFTNAIRYRAEAKPVIHISTGTGGPGNWFVAVSDNGPGIEPALAERVFRPFKKLSNAGGAGLGLTVCRRIVELHGGEIWAEPREGGAEFRFFIDGETPCS